MMVPLLFIIRSNSPKVKIVDSIKERNLNMNFGEEETVNLDYLC